MLDKMRRVIASFVIDVPWEEIPEDALRRFLELSPVERGKAWAACIRNSSKPEILAKAEVPALLPPASSSLRVVTMPAQSPPVPPVLGPITASVSGDNKSVIEIPSDREVKYPQWAIPMHKDLDKEGPAIFNPAGLDHWFHPVQKQGGPVKAQVVYDYLRSNERKVGENLIEGCLGLRELDAIKDRELAYYLEYFSETRIFGWRSVARSKKGTEKADEEFLRQGTEGLPDLTNLKKNIAGLWSRAVPGKPPVAAVDALENLWVPYLVVIARDVKIAWLRLDRNLESTEPALLFK
jgi:hypothetical protein